MEGDDLVVIEIGDDKGLGGVDIGEHADRVATDAEGVEPRRVGGKIRARGGEEQRILAEQPQPVGDISRRSAKGLAQRGDVEGHVEHVQLIGEDVMAEAIGKHHDAVDRQRAGH